MQKSKSDFMNSPKRKNLSQSEKDKRWKQYQQSKRSNASDERAGRTRGTRIAVKRDNKHDHLRLRLSHCARDYLTALEFPFTQKDAACVPDLHALPSRKMRCKTRFTFSTGTTGDGYAVANSWSNVSNFTAVAVTSATWAGGAVIGNTTTPPAGVQSVFQTKLPFTSSTLLTQNAQARTVGFGMRVRYIGPELARSGQIIAVRLPDNEDSTNYSFSTVRSFETAKTFTNKRQWIYVQYRPVKPAEYEYSSDGGTASNGGLYAFPLVIAITGTTDTNGAPGPAPFEGEIIRYVEYIGNIASVTNTHTDLQGMSHIRNSLPVKSAYDNPVTRAHKVISNVGKSLMEAAPVIGAGALGASAFSGGETAAAASESRALIPYAAEAAESASAGFAGLMNSMGGIASGLFAGAEELGPLLALAL